MVEAIDIGYDQTRFGFLVRMKVSNLNYRLAFDDEDQLHVILLTLAGYKDGNLFTQYDYERKLTHAWLNRKP